eukprot:TRINITY_DN49199_c0_g1_i1.p2 TRINITY_DN49199_c0_g1~~TRINITY_DN49199_c0_g1_i1.p2  ORF type:complete len:242 (-),score=56.28 TRINITY_DN49199_c0_g1_i1:41-703(-)
MAGLAPALAPAPRARKRRRRAERVLLLAAAAAAAAAGIASSFNAVGSAAAGAAPALVVPAALAFSIGADVPRTLRARRRSAALSPCPPFSARAGAAACEPSPPASATGDEGEARASASAGELERAVASGAPVAVDFFASWCGPCALFAAELASVEERLRGKIVVLKVDVDLERELAAMFKVKALPTLVMFKGGSMEPVAKIEGAVMRDDLYTRIVDTLLS